MDLFRLLYVDGMIFVCLAMPTLLVAMMLVTRSAPRALPGRRAYGHPGPLASARS